MISTKPPKEKACRVCHLPCTPFNSMLPVHPGECQQKFAEAHVARSQRKREMAERRAVKEKLQAIEKISVFEKRAEKVVNEYVRLRDRCKGLGCVSCDKPASWDGQWHASHFRSVGAATAVRFNLWNIHSACWICNKLYSGRIDQYEPEIIRRIGQEKLDWLRAQNKVTKYSREYLERLRAVFAKRVRRMKKRLQDRSLQEISDFGQQQGWDT
jgi:hypothetical protein